MKVKWEKFMGLNRLLVGDKHVATVFLSGAWALVHNNRVIDSGVGNDIDSAKAYVSLLAIEKGLICLEEEE